MMTPAPQWGALALAALAALAAGPAHADETGSSGSPAWFALPVLFYTPETRLGYGALGGVHFATGPGLEISDVQLIAVYTANDQAILDLRARIFPSATLTLGLTLEAAEFPDRFYGIGSGAPQDAREDFTSRYVDASFTPEWYVVARRLRAGPRLWLRQEHVGDLDPEGALASGAVRGAGAHRSFGAGASVTWDSRDSRFRPSSGRYVEAWYVWAPGTASFGRGLLDVRQFTPVGRGVVLGVDGHVELAHGAVPFTLLPLLGGDPNLRGYYQGRWRDRLMYAVQSELRFPVAGRFAGVVFAGISDVAASPGSFALRTVRPAAGAGARFRLTDDGLNVRLDVGVGQEGANVYFNLGEAF